MSEQLQQELLAIQERNRRVELDKAWETSWTRRLFIAALTYAVAGFWLVLIHEVYSWFKAFVPAGGYLLSTLSLPVIKRWWAKRYIPNSAE